MNFCINEMSFSCRTYVFLTESRKDTTKQSFFTTISGSLNLNNGSKKELKLRVVVHAYNKESEVFSFQGPVKCTKTNFIIGEHFIFQVLPLRSKPEENFCHYSGFFIGSSGLLIDIMHFV